MTIGGFVENSFVKGVPFFNIHILSSKFTVFFQHLLHFSIFTYFTRSLVILITMNHKAMLNKSHDILVEVIIENM